MPEPRFLVSLITPTYNERDNLPLLASEIFGAIRPYPEIDLELIVVDDNSPDGTGQVAEALRDRFPVRVVHRPGRLGLGSAVMEGFRASDRPILGVIDADLSHDPAVLKDLISHLSTHDITIGSRYHPESRVEKWPWYRKVISQIGVFCARMLTGVHDPLTGYFFLHRPVLEGVRLTSPGFKILLEILVKGTYNSVLEIPFVFRDREHSSSKLNLKEHVRFARQLLVFAFQPRSRASRRVSMLSRIPDKLS
jgi:dolichol-phosphate mannosyltransferase